MKKRSNSITILTIMAIFAAGFAIAEPNKTFNLANQERTTGAKTAQHVRYASSTWGCDVNSFGNMSSYSVRIEGNQGGSAFDPQGMATHTRTFANYSAQFRAGVSSFEITSHAVKGIRANILSLSGGDDPRLSITCTGRD